MNCCMCSQEKEYAGIMIRGKMMCAECIGHVLKAADGLRLDALFDCIKKRNEKEVKNHAG